MIKKSLKFFSVTLIIFILSFSCFFISVTSLNDSISTSIRTYTQASLNSYIETLSDKTASQSLTTSDKIVLNISALSGICISYFRYPEASKLLFHYIYGNGEQLELSNAYFIKSQYLKKVISTQGKGQHGPINLKQSDDWRLSLTLNPFYLDITEKTIRIYHPKIEFAHKTDTSIFTYVPIGKLKIRVYDNIVSALEPKPFYVYAEWNIE